MEHIHEVAEALRKIGDELDSDYELQTYVLNLFNIQGSIWRNWDI